MTKTQTTTPTTTRTRYPALDGIRAVAALAVVGTHVAFWTGRYDETTLGLLYARLDFGVALFFVLSGFLLFKPWVTQPRVSVPRFFQHRALRILPAYWVTVIVVFAIVPSEPGKGEGVNGLFRNLTLTQIYGGGLQHPDLTQMWSLATEVAFYLLLPVFGWALVRLSGGSRVRLLIGCGVLAAVTVVWFSVTRSAVVLDVSAVYWLPAFLDWFAGGMALSVVVAAWESGRRPDVLKTIAAAPGCCWVLAACLIAISATPIAGGATLGQSLTKNLLYLGAGLAIVAPCVLRPELTPSTRWIAAPVPRWVGRISYEVFLVHLIVLDGVMRLMDYPLFTGSLLIVFVLTTALSLPAAWLLFRLVEVPARRLRTRIDASSPAPPPSRSSADTRTA